MIRYLFVGLSVIGALYLVGASKAKFLSNVVYTVPHINFALTIGFLIVASVAVLGTAKLKFGK